MKTYLYLCLVFCLPQISFAQVGPISPPMCELVNKKRIIAEVIDVERRPEGDPKYSILKIISVFQIDRFRDTVSPKIIRARHAHENFELFQGQHILSIERTHCHGEWFIERSTHGEIVDLAERTRRAEAVERRWGGRNVERELCYMKIKQAYDADFAKFRLENAETCEKYIGDYDREFRRQTEGEMPAIKIE